MRLQHLRRRVRDLDGKFQKQSLLSAAPLHCSDFAPASLGAGNESFDYCK